MEGLRSRPQFLAVVALIVIAVALPLVLTSGYYRGVGIAIGAMAVGTVGFVLLLGYAHQLALGQAAFCLVGGYANAILTAKHGWDPVAALVVGAVMAMVLAYILGKPILKLRGFILAMASLALQLILIVVAKELPFTGMALGIHGVPKFAIFGFRLENDLSFYYVVWAFVLAAVLIGLSVDRSRIGRALKAIAGSESAAGSVGIDITRYKVQMFVISAGMASVSGSLIVHYLRIMEPHVFDFAYSLNIVTAVIAGGLMSIWGGVLGASIFIVVREIVRGFGIPYLETIVMGVITCVVLIAFPRGFAGLVADVFRRILPVRETATAVPVRDVQLRKPDVPATAAVAGQPAGGDILLEVAKVHRAFGSLRAVNDVSFSVPRGAITALIGPNGAGKTTMFNLISGHQPVDAGSIRFAGTPIEQLMPHEVAGLGLGRTFQNLQLFANMTVLENVMCGHHRRASAGIVAVALRLPVVARDERAIRAAAERALAFVGLTAAAGKMPTALPFGHQRLVEIARALALEPTLLIMDEPASGLNDTETEQLAEIILRINASGVTVLLVEHDIRLVMGLADRLVVMHHGEKIAEGAPDVVRKDPNVIAAYLGREA